MCEQEITQSKLVQELNYFRLAVIFFTRIPMGNGVHYQPEFMHSCTRYFPLVGWLLALLLVVLWQVAETVLGPLVAVVMVMVASVLLTGALHEDGLADTCDGFWGGFTPERKIDIMKDSRIGTYGTCALALSLGLKAALLCTLARHNMLVWALCIAYPLSRAFALSHVQDLPYVSSRGSVQKNKSDPLAKPVSAKHLFFVFGTGAIAALWLPLVNMILLFGVLIVVRYGLRNWMRHHIGGFTGDVLGAAQQIQELVIYLFLVALAGGLA